jgi:hypothetical protein
VGSYRRVLVAASLVALLLVVTVALLFGPRYLDRHRFAVARDGCSDVPMAPAVTPQTYPDSYLWPYGAIRGCRVVSMTAHVFGEVDVSYVLVLQTDMGPAVVRMDYRNTAAGRQYVAEAVELDPGGAHLADDDAARITQAITGRGGRQPTPWIVHYGDG